MAKELCSGGCFSRHWTGWSLRAEGFGHGPRCFPGDQVIDTQRKGLGKVGLHNGTSVRGGQ